MKRIAVFGAAGSVGRCVVSEALDRGHEVTGVVRNPQRAAGLPDLAVPAFAEASDGAAIRAVLRDQDVAVMALRPPAGREAELVGYTRTLLDTAVETGVPVVIVGGAASLRFPDQPAWTVLTRPGFLPDAVRPIAQACHAQRDAVLSTGGEGWSHICPPASLEPGRRTGRYRLGTDMLVTGEDGRSAISVEDFAIAIVDEAESRAHAGRSFTVGW
ncbi:NAD(P)H-binding protein [Maricaulis sp.]|uniref:NAD(P)-dependent oxidoreductase n=1 Tax=Maricaulis sp. TaxID=1486257 RepID=UPI00329A1FE1